MLSRVNITFNNKVKGFVDRLVAAFHDSGVYSEDELKELVGHKRFIDGEIEKESTTDSIGKWYGELCDKTGDSDAVNSFIFRRGKENLYPNFENNHVFRAFSMETWYDNMGSSERKALWASLQDIHKTYEMTFQVIGSLGGIFSGMKIDRTKPPNMQDIMSQMFNPECLDHIQRIITDKTSREKITDAASSIFATDKCKDTIDIKKLVPDEKDGEDNISKQFQEFRDTVDMENMGKLAAGLMTGESTIADVIRGMPQDGENKEDIEKVEELMSSMLQKGGFDIRKFQLDSKTDK